MYKKAALYNFLACFLGLSWAWGSPGVQVDLDLRQPASRAATVTMVFSEVKALGRLMKPGSVEAFTYSDFAVKQNQNDIIFTEQDDALIFEPPLNGRFQVSYTVTPGGPGRHGLQGYIHDEFASVDGRLFLQPANARAYEQIGLTVQVPAHWREAVPFERVGGTYTVQTDELPAFYQLRYAAYLFGPFQFSHKQVGTTELSVVVYAPWSPEHKTYLVDKSVALYRYFHSRFGLAFDRYFIHWTPASENDRKIYGTAWSRGSQFEMPRRRLRNWELLAHRLGHAVNKYPPSGMVISRQEDNWFSEGWASYMEIIATAETGLADGEFRWNRLYQRYLKVLDEHPQRDWALVRDSESRGETTEYLHYVKAPLVVKMLAYYLKQNAGVELNAFMAHAYKTYGRMGRGFPVRLALEDYAGISLEAFWRHMVHGRGSIVPVWKPYIQRLSSSLPMDFALKAGDVPVPTGYLAYLAASGKIQRYSDLMSVAAREVAYRQRYRQDGMKLVPEFILQDIDRLPHAVRWRLYELFQQWLPAPTKPPQASLAGASASAGVLAELMLHEWHYEKLMGSDGVKAVQIKQNGEPTLLMAADQPFTLYTRWSYAGVQARFELIAPGGEIHARRDLLVQSDWHFSYNEFLHPRSAEEGIWTVRISIDDEPVIERAFWHRPRLRAFAKKLIKPD